MTLHLLLPRLSRWCAALIACAPCMVAAAPGAHGPSGEHLDTPGVAATQATLPRLEAKSESFELVGTLQGSELSILVDRYDTNEPVLGAALEVESGGIKAVAKARPDHGDYATQDANLVALLSKPGEHALVFTLVAGKESDLLDGTLITPPAAAGDHDHGASGSSVQRAAWLAAPLVAAALGVIAWRRRRHRSRAAAREMRP